MKFSVALHCLDIHLYNSRTCEGVSLFFNKQAMYSSIEECLLSADKEFSNKGRKYFEKQLNKTIGWKGNGGESSTVKVICKQFHHQCLVVYVR